MSPIFELKLASPMIDLNPGAEHPVDRNLLLDIAPDRESLIMGTEDILKVRDALALKVPDKEIENGTHWLTKQETFTHIKLRNVPKRISALGWSGEGEGVITNGSTTDIHTLLESFPPSMTESTASLTGNKTGTIVNLTPIAPSLDESTTVTASVSTLNVNKPLPAAPKDEDEPQEDQEKDLPFRLTNSSVLISPRPLGPTHTLLLYSESPTSSGVYEKVVEIPVCDLLVAVHCPNLRLGGTYSSGSDTGSLSDGRSVSVSASGCGGGDAEVATRIPYRQDSLGNLPRMLLRVGDLSTFPAVLIYMHARDRARLIRQVVGDIVWRAIRHFYDPEVSEISYPPHATRPNAAARGLGSQSSIIVALRLALAEVPYADIVKAGAAVLALERNLRDVGLQEKKLVGDVERLRKALVKAVNGKSRDLGAGTEGVEIWSVAGGEVGNRDDGDDEVEVEEMRIEGSSGSRWKLKLHLGLGWGWKLVPCVPNQSRVVA